MSFTDPGVSNPQKGGASVCDGAGGEPWGDGASAPEPGSEGGCVFCVVITIKGRSTGQARRHRRRATRPGRNQGPGQNCSEAEESEHESDHVANVWEPRSEPPPVRQQHGDWRPGRPQVSRTRGNTPAHRSPRLPLWGRSRAQAHNSTLKHRDSSRLRGTEGQRKDKRIRGTRVGNGCRENSLTTCARPLENG